MVSRSYQTGRTRHVQTATHRGGDAKLSMRDQNAQTLLAKVMNWESGDDVSSRVPSLQLLADYKYDHYQRFGPGRRFIESLALWLNQFDVADRDTALNLVLE